MVCEQGMAWRADFEVCQIFTYGLSTMGVEVLLEGTRATC